MKNLLKYIVVLLTYLSVLNVQGQCTLSATSSGFNGAYTQVYVLVDQNGDIVDQNTTGTFNSVANGVYQIHALNYDPLNAPAPLPSGLIGSPLTDVGSTTSGCYNADFLTDFVTQVCSACQQNFEFCDGENVVITSSGSMAGYTQLYVLVDVATDLIVATNASGDFTSDVSAGNSYQVYALNYNPADAPSPLPTVGQSVLTTGSTSAGCYNSDFLTDYVCVTVNTLPSVPSASVTVQPDCAVTTGTIEVTAPLGANYEYSVDGIAYQSGTTFPGLNPDNYDVTVQDLTTTCVSAVTMLTVDPVPSNPSAPSASVTAQPDCAVTTGTIEVTAPLGANYEYSVDGITYQSSTTFPGLNPGNYDVTVQDLTTTCISAVTTLTVDPVPSNPATPSANVTVQPDCINTTGEIQVTAPLGANYSYSVDGVTYQLGPDFAGLTPGSYDVTVLDATTSCESSATTLTIDPIPSAPSAPTASVTVQPSCTDATGTIEVTAPIGATFVYSVDGVTFQPGTTFSGLNPGNYDVTVQDNTNGCESAATTLTVNTNPGAPATPTASVTVQPDCNTPTGTIEVTAPLGANLEYSIDGSTYQPGTTFSGLAPGNYDVSVIDNSSMCVSATLTLTVTALPTAPVASVTVQPDCITPTGTIEVTAPLGANYEYSIDGSTYQTGTTFPGLAPGSYDVTVQDINTGCVSSATTLDVVADPITPVANVSVQPDCNISTGTIVISDPIGANYSYSVDNVNYQNGTTFSGLMPGNYDVTVQNTSTGCISAPLTLTVNAAPLVPLLDPIVDTTVCDTYLLEIIEGTDLTGNEAYYSDWPSAGGTILTGAITGTQTVFVYDGSGACADSTSFVVTVNLTPSLTVSNPTAVCEPNTVDISGSASTDVGTLQWYTDAGLATVVADPTQVTVGTYYVQADNNGCTSDDVVTVTVNPIPSAPQAGTDTTYCLGDNFELLTVSGTGGTYNWYDMSDNYLGTGSTFAPFDVLGSTHYHVTETVNGCEGPFTMVIISVEGCDDEPVCGELFVPNAFTPNTDSNNDSFGVSVLDNECIEDMNLKVFDRWGKVVFSSTDPNERWDGTFKDEELDQAVFHYILDIKLFSENEYRLVKGNVTLIR